MRFLLLLLIFVWNSALAVGNFEPVNIKSVFVRENRIDIYLEKEHANPTGCSNKSVLLIMANESTNSGQMIAAAMAAHLAGRKISGWIVGCADQWGKLSAINID